MAGTDTLEPPLGLRSISCDRPFTGVPGVNGDDGVPGREIAMLLDFVCFLLFLAILGVLQWADKELKGEFVERE